MNKSILYISPSDRALFENICTQQRMTFELMCETDKNLVYEVSYWSPTDFFWLGVYFGLNIGKQILYTRYQTHNHTRYEAHTD
jgi:hypothetical protein